MAPVLWLRLLVSPQLVACPRGSNSRVASWRRSAIASGAFIHGDAVPHAGTVIAATHASGVKAVTPATALGTDGPSHRKVPPCSALGPTALIAVFMEPRVGTDSAATAAG